MRPAASLAPALLVAVAAAACGDNGGGAGDGAPPADASLPCGAELCGAVGAVCGTTVDSCGADVDCGTCTWTGEPIGELAMAPAIDVGDAVRVAYVESAATPELRIAERGASGWTSELVTPLAGAPLGPVDLAVTWDGTRWISFIDDQAQLRVASAAAGGAWTVSDPLGAGAADAIAIDGAGQPVVALAGVVGTATGVFVLTPDADGWQATPVGDPTTAGAPRGLAVAVRSGLISLAWRDPGDDVLRYATGNGATFAIDIVDPSALAPRDPGALALAFDPSDRPHVVYGRAGQLIHAVRAGDLWHPTTVAEGGADGDVALAIGPDGVVHAVGFDAHGLQLVDGVGGVFLTQPVSDRCADGVVDAAVGSDGVVHVVAACADGVEYLLQAGPA